MPKLIGEDLWFHNMEVDNYLSDPHNAITHLTMAEKADLLADIGEQLRSDDEHDVNDGFRAALAWDFAEGEIRFDDYCETMDLCAIVEAVEKGHILYG